MVPFLYCKVYGVNYTTFVKAAGKVLFYPFLCWQDNKMYNTLLHKQFTLISCRLMSHVESDDC